MKLFSVILAALAATLAAADQFGPCTAKYSAQASGDCSAIESCLATVMIKPGSNANSADVTLSGNDCGSGVGGAMDNNGVAAVTLQGTKAGMLVLSGGQDGTKGVIGGSIMGSDGQPTCTSILTVTEGQCLYSDVGPAAPSAAAGTVASVAGLAAAAAAGAAALLL